MRALDCVVNSCTRVMVSCPSENEFLARVSGALPSERALIVDSHVDGCSDCRILLAEATHWAEEARHGAPSRTTFTPGEVVAERYVVTRWLGAGGMGEVYEVHDKLLGEQIALKTVVATIADDERALARLHAEVRMARRITHDNVCRVYDLGVHQRGGERIAFLTMELVRGVTLRQYVRRVGPLDLDQALPLVAQMVAALRHAHAAGIVHRDFKSDNVLLVPGEKGVSERVVVTDFGLARESLVRELPLTPHSRAVLGTLDYMSPEQLMGAAAGPSSDIYSLGVVIHELLTGQLPFQGESPLARAVIRVARKAPPLTDALPNAKASAIACVSRCLETDPGRRFATAEEVFRALEGDRQPLRSPRYRRTLGLAATLVALGLALYVHSVAHGELGDSSSSSTPNTLTARGPSLPDRVPPEATAVASESEQVARPVSITAPESAASARMPAATPKGAARRARLYRPPRADGLPARAASAPTGARAGERPLGAPYTVIDPVPGGDALMNPFVESGADGDHGRQPQLPLPLQVPLQH
jgi:serine/threonine protein kinase